MKPPLSDSLLDEVHGLLMRCLGGEAEPEEVEYFNDLLLNSEEARSVYKNAIRDSVRLYRWAAAEELRGDGLESEPSLAASHPTLSPLPSPLSPSFVGGPVFSYMVATVVLCVMLLSAWPYKISHVYEADVVDNSRRSTTSGQKDQPLLVFVGRITGMKDCRWANGGESTILGASVALDREYALSSGLLEITYKSGARVILEGPCTYKVDSDAGGYLALGKLTARVETKGSGFGVQGSEVRGQRSEVRGQKSPNPQSPIPNPFFVRTPTALVTDLGTEFGVEVAANGDTVSCVFQGSIKVQGLSASADSGAVLKENESIQVSRVRETHHDSTKTTQVRFTHPTTPPKFVRQIPRQKIKTFDLVDVVAGGDGFSGRRNGGIDPTTGRVRKLRTKMGAPPIALEGDGTYHLVEGMPFIDGVFIPDGGGDAVQVDSAGHLFDWFSDTDNTTWQVIWAAGAFSPEQKYSSTVDGVDYASPGHGLLLMHANNAITFDLEAIRRANPGSKLLRFRATAGMPGTHTATNQCFADVLVLVDGGRRYQHRLEYNGRRAVSIMVEIQDKDRFLTLAATDAGDSISHDWVVLGDPRLEMMKKNQADDTKKTERKGEAK